MRKSPRRQLEKRASATRELLEVRKHYKNIGPISSSLAFGLFQSGVTGPKGQVIQFDVYLDQTMPAVADWREIHKPYLEKARALIVICTVVR